MKWRVAIEDGILFLATQTPGTLGFCKLVDCQSLLRVVQRYAKRKECGPPMEVREYLTCRKGLVIKISFICTLCEKEDEY